MLISDFTIMCDDCGRKYRIPSDSLDVDYAWENLHRAKSINGLKKLRQGN